jgi:hypothetical protein
VQMRGVVVVVVLRRQKVEVAARFDPCVRVSSVL